MCCFTSEWNNTVSNAVTCQLSKAFQIPDVQEYGNIQKWCFNNHQNTTMLVKRNTRYYSSDMRFTMSKHASSTARFFYSAPFTTLLRVSASSCLSNWLLPPGHSTVAKKSIPSSLCLSLLVWSEYLFMPLLQHWQCQQKLKYTTPRAHAHTCTLALFLSNAHILCMLQSSWPYNKTAHCAEEEWGKRRGEVTA